MRHCNHIKLSILCGIALALSSCETPFQPMDMEGESMAISATFSTDPRLPGFLVFASKLSPFGEPGGNDLISNAEVLLYKNNEFIGPLNPDMLGTRAVYYMGLTPEENVPYTIRITAEGYPFISATDMMPPRTNALILSVADVEKKDLPNQGINYQFNITVEVRDRPLESNYYHLYLEAIMEDSQGQKFFGFCTFKNALNNDPSLTPYLLNQSVLLDGRLFDGEEKNYTFSCSFDVPSGFTMKGVEMDLRHVSTPYFEFHISHAAQIASGANGVTEPPPLYSNVNNASGFFGSYQSTRDSIEVQ